MAVGIEGIRGGLPARLGLVELPVGCIEHDPDQPRTEGDFESLERLARSLVGHGQLQPIVVRPTSEPGRFRLILGERRWRAAQLAGRDTVAAVIRDVDRTGEDVFELQVVENSLREDLSPMDQARAFRSLMERRGWSASKLAESLHLHRATVTRALALLGLPGAVQDHLDEGRLPADVARELLRLESPEDQIALADRVAAGEVDRRTAIEEARRSSPPGDVGAPVPTTRVFPVAGGRVTVGLDRPGTLLDLAAALGEAGLTLRDEIRASSP